MSAPESCEEFLPLCVSLVSKARFPDVEFQKQDVWKLEMSVPGSCQEPVAYLCVPGGELTNVASTRRGKNTC